MCASNYYCQGRRQMIFFPVEMAIVKRHCSSFCAASNPILTLKSNLCSSIKFIPNPPLLDFLLLISFSLCHSQKIKFLFSSLYGHPGKIALTPWPNYLWPWPSLFQPCLINTGCLPGFLTLIFIKQDPSALQKWSWDQSCRSESGHLCLAPCLNTEWGFFLFLSDMLLYTSLKKNALPQMVIQPQFSRRKVQVVYIRLDVGHQWCTPTHAVTTWSRWAADYSGTGSADQESRFWLNLQYAADAKRCWFGRIWGLTNRSLPALDEVRVISEKQVIIHDSWHLLCSPIHLSVPSLIHSWLTVSSVSYEETWRGKVRSVQCWIKK